ncbi:MAG: cysteine desulfurase family protein [Planctomycetota bacterium]|jgi:cysteine desulfurase
MTNPPIYLDNHATTRCDPRVVDAMFPYFSEQYGNASSVGHWFGWDAKDSVDAAREQVASLVGATPREVIFTSGATEANNLALKGIVAPLLRHTDQPRPHVIVNAAEHRAVLDPARRLERNGAAVTVLPVDEFGQVSPQSVVEAITPETVLVSVMLANNEVGTVNPVETIAAAVRDANPRTLIHCDAVQAAGKIPTTWQQLDVDLLSLSAHKMYGPKGIGALLVRRGGRRVALEPLLDGGGHEQHLRSGTLPVPLIVGFGEACRIAQEEFPAEAVRVAALRDTLWTHLSVRLDGLTRNGHPTECLPGNLNVSFEGVDGEALLNAMTAIAVSSGSACTSADPEPSHVLRAIGRSDQLTRSSLRFGLGRFNTPEEIEAAAEFVTAQVRRLRSASA